MKTIYNCRRTLLAIYAITLLFILGYSKNQDVAIAISTIAIGIAGANAYEKKKPYNSNNSGN